MSRETEAILAKWRELERAVEAIDDPELREGLEQRIREVRAEYQTAMRSVIDQTEPFDLSRRTPDLA
jgi:phage shock protein A